MTEGPPERPLPSPEVEGRAAAALCGYDPVERGVLALAQAMNEAAGQVGWSGDDVAEVWQRFAPVGTCISDDAEGAWIIENVATLPDFRRQGLVNRLLENVLEAGRAKGHRLAQISIIIGNMPAQIYTGQDAQDVAAYVSRVAGGA